jgi:predicted transcriptional regulator
MQPTEQYCKIIELLSNPYSSARGNFGRLIQGDWFISDKVSDTLIDKTDLKIINLLSRDGRISYRTIASTVRITPNAVKKRIHKLSSKGMIQKFVVRINPVLLGYDKECYLIIKHIDKEISEGDIVKKLNLVGNV